MRKSCHSDEDHHSYAVRVLRYSLPLCSSLQNSRSLTLWSFATLLLVFGQLGQHKSDALAFNPNGWSERIPLRPRRGQDFSLITSLHAWAHQRDWLQGQLPQKLQRYASADPRCNLCFLPFVHNDLHFQEMRTFFPQSRKKTHQRSPTNSHSLQRSQLCLYCRSPPEIRSQKWPSLPSRNFGCIWNTHHPRLDGYRPSLYLRRWFRLV